MLGSGQSIEGGALLLVIVSCRSRLAGEGPDQVLQESEGYGGYVGLGVLAPMLHMGQFRILLITEPSILPGGQDGSLGGGCQGVCCQEERMRKEAEAFFAAHVRGRWRWDRHGL